MYIPLSTYRIQFNKDFTFKKFEEIIDYLHLLGIGTIYASPVFAAVPGSNHGYDVINPHRINPEIGDEHEFGTISMQLKRKNIGWLQDIVPNHMAIHKDNDWIMDILKKGISSKYAAYFDIDFSHPEFTGKLMIPFLGKTPKEAIQQGELKLINYKNKIGFSYFDFFFPLNEETENLLTGKMEEEDFLRSINADFSGLEEILEKQFYKLTYWKEAEQHLNFRRFFTINNLICLAMEKDKVFHDYHRKVKNLIDEKKIQGLRIDHIDGLLDPGSYLHKLRTISGDEIYMVVEKILQGEERIPEDWPIEGTTGYDFLVLVNQLFTCKRNYPAFQRFYKDITGIIEDAEAIIYSKKKLVLQKSMQGDMENLVRKFEEGGFIGKGDTGFDHEKIKNAISEFLLAFPRYKLYLNDFPLSDDNREIIAGSLRKARGKVAPTGVEVLRILRKIFLETGELPFEKKTKALNFLMRCMQFTGPIMAKGVEDTAMYYYNCFIGHNEVGDGPGSKGITIKEFHKKMIARQENNPLTLNTTSTHDTKRGEDVRSRLNAISELPRQWIDLIRKWIKINHRFKTVISGEFIPSINEEYFIYQALVGVFPFNQEINEKLLLRLDNYLIKALREAKENTDWDEPDQEYERAVLSFNRNILKPGNEFLRSFLPFQRRISEIGIHNSLSQLFLKFTCPGIPDVYQGTELWDFTLVDPDNRSPVDYSCRYSILKDLIRNKNEKPEIFLKHIRRSPENGHIKLWMTHVLLKERSLNPDLFIHGKYIPLEITGEYKSHILAFARVYRNTWYIVIIPLYIAILLERSRSKTINWKDTSLRIPDEAPEKWFVIDENHSFHGKGIFFLTELLHNGFPCLLKGTKYVPAGLRVKDRITSSSGK